MSNLDREALSAAAAAYDREWLASESHYRAVAAACEAYLAASPAIAEIEEFLNDHSDAEIFPDGASPNREMQLLLLLQNERGMRL